PLEELFARYKNVELIGEGGFARVYRAERKDGSVVALKIPMSLTEAGGERHSSGKCGTGPSSAIPT
ncbi:hypothetical protein, partial [Thermococcus peptonophilus]|uniref:hypothetical protein n=1 Tax=Thermococcus peptonophilus TaxID=53952 RepID=UPI000B323A4E